MALRNIFVRRNVVPYKDLQAEGQSSDLLQLGVDLPVNLSLIEGLDQDGANIITSTSVDSPTSLHKPKRTGLDVNLGQVYVPTMFFPEGIVANDQVLCTVIDDRMSNLIAFVNVIDMGTPAQAFYIRVDAWSELTDDWYVVSFIGGAFGAVGRGDSSNPYSGTCFFPASFAVMPPRIRLRAEINGVGQTPTVIVSGYKMY